MDQATEHGTEHGTEPGTEHGTEHGTDHGADHGTNQDASQLAGQEHSHPAFTHALQASLDGFWDWQLAPPVLRCSARWQAISGYPEQTWAGPIEHWLGRVHPQDHPRLEADLRAMRAGKSKSFCNSHRLRHAAGEWRWVVARGVPHPGPDGRVARIAGSLTDETEQRMFDPLTALPNRAWFVEKMERRVEAAHAQARWDFAVLALGLQRFKLVNERLGRSGGDALLTEIAERLRAFLATQIQTQIQTQTQTQSQTQSVPLMARLSGAEFLICLEDVRSDDACLALGHDLDTELRRPFLWQRQTIAPAPACGIALAGAGYLHPEEMIRDAETALLQAKSGRQGSFVCYSSGMRERAVASMELEAELERAIARGELVLHYQPEIDLASRRIVGFEALVRWQHPRLGTLTPADFIPMAEETGLIVPLGHWGLTEACRQLRLWSREAHCPHIDLRVSVNFSARQFAQPGLVERVQDELENSSIDPRSLRLEMTESSLIADPEQALQTMRELQDLGVGLHMDDFGIGYSSLNHLHRYPFDTLKIDRSFIQGMTETKDSAAIVRTILELARSLDLAVVAEGIETDQQAERLQQMGCPYGQGFLFAKPMAAAEVTALLRAGSAPAPLVH